MSTGQENRRASHVPDARELLDEAARYQAGGALDRALERYQDVVESATDDSLLAEAYRRMASVHRTRCDWDAAIESARHSRAAAERAGRRDLIAEGLNAEAVVYQSRGQWGEAVPLLERVLGISDEPRVRGIALQNLGAIAADRGEMEVAEERFSESYECFQQAGYERGVATAMVNRGRAALDGGRLEPAVELCAEALKVAKALDDLALVALARMNLAEALAASGRRIEALDLATAALGFFTSTGDLWRQVEVLRLMGDLHAGEGNDEPALRCYVRALELARRIGAGAEIPRLLERLGDRAESHGGPAATEGGESAARDS